ncbi:MAG: outer membrane lipid asymmetry maintenance protein MlaD [Alphaproteobacteria bacterium]|uniref:Outer membrane lipid asymmetry maintenance protein MlaD n=1 Tax=Candidatus Nitrobium versatile TaxID=2884831 RepID=A0A953J1M8_9BACT|nr:outer membrane lipid asymmetry maintenance protein MlaD [Candidatus Nitrobium versatile]
MRKFDVELAAGFFLLLGIISLAFLSIKLGRLEALGAGGYTLSADFDRAGGIRRGAAVEIAGVEIGKVKDISLKDYQAHVELLIYGDVKIQEDAIASIKTKGLIGEKYVQISPGGSDRILKNGERIRETESSIDFEELISKYVYGKV